VELKLKRIAFLRLLFTVVCCALEAQSSPPSAVFRGTCASDLPRFEDWYPTTRLPYGESYVATEKRKRQLLENYPKLKLQMSLEETEKILGNPDFAMALPPVRLATAPEPRDQSCNNEAAFILKKNSENATDMEDIAVYLFFSRDGKLYWVAPQNLPALKPLGSATGEAPIVESQAVWKEYVFSDDGFAITLPGDPHPHKSPQMANGMAYSVPLSNGARFSLYTEQANDRCTDTVRGQLRDAQNKAESNGYRVISFREVDGSGYKGIEFVQQVPTLKIDYERWICAAHRLYLFAADWNPNDSEPKELHRIVGSWRLVAGK
jgi:hypothetical protein